MRPWLAALLLLVACDKGSSSPAPAPTSSASPPRAAPPASTSAAPKPPKAPTTKLTGQQLRDAYAAVVAGDDPYEKELAAVKSKLGDPQRTKGDTSLWWGWSPQEGALDPECYELSMSPTEGSSVGATDWNKCGMGE